MSCEAFSSCTKILIINFYFYKDLNPQLEGLTVRVGSCANDTSSNTMCGDPVNRGQATAGPRTDLIFNCPQGTYGQYVFVDLPGEDKILTMCEVTFEREPGEYDYYLFFNIVMHDLFPPYWQHIVLACIRS